MPEFSVHLVEDDDRFRNRIAGLLKESSAGPDIEVRESAYVHDSLRIFEESQPDVLIVDLGLPTNSVDELVDFEAGFSLIQEARIRNPNVYVIILTAQLNDKIGGRIRDAEPDACWFKGITPQKLDSDLVTHLNAYVKRSFARANPIASKWDLLDSDSLIDSLIIGSCPPIVKLKETVERQSNNETPILLVGETGTGKELFAQALHYCGTRMHEPFATCNCAGMPNTLLTSALFGHCKGAYTGAESEEASH